MTIEELLKDYRPTISQIVELLHELIKEAVPTATEKVYPAWRGIGYTHPEAGYFCAIFPQESEVRLAFENGAFLSDPDHLLQIPSTSSKQVRYIVVKDKNEIQIAAVEAMIRQAVSVSS